MSVASGFEPNLCGSWPGFTGEGLGESLDGGCSCLCKSTRKQVGNMGGFKPMPDFCHTNTHTHTYIHALHCIALHCIHIHTHIYLYVYIHIRMLCWQVVELARVNTLLVPTRPIGYSMYQCVGDPDDLDAAGCCGLPEAPAANSLGKALATSPPFAWEVGKDQQTLWQKYQKINGCANCGSSCLVNSASRAL
jgi:hypothetical protein